MRIVITSNYELGNETGSAKVAEELAKKVSIRNKVLFICLGTKFRIYEKNKNLEVLEVTSVNIKNIFVPIITPIIMYQVFKKLDLFKPDVVHAQNSILTSALVQMWSMLNNTPFVVTFHHVPSEPIKHLVPHLSKNLLFNLVQDIYKNTSLKNFLKNSDLVISQNDLIYKSIRTIDKKVAIEIINNGIEIKKLNQLRIQKKDWVMNKSKVINFVFLGSFNYRKNQLFLVKTFKYLPFNYVLNLYGNFKTGEDYLDQIKDLISKNKISNINIYDFELNINKVFEKNDYLVSASKKEAQSLVIIQSLAAGKPIIGISNETIDELINNTNGLTVKKGISPKNFALQIIKFTKENNYIALSKKCVEDSKKFDINLVVSKIEESYQRLSKSSS